MSADDVKRILLLLKLDADVRLDKQQARVLSEHIERMQAVVEAAEEAIEISHSHDSNPTRVMRMRERLRQVLTAWKG